MNINCYLNTVVYTFEQKLQSNNSKKRKIKKYNSLEEILQKIDNEINRMIYDIGLDQYLLNKNSFKAEDYNKMIYEYDELFEKEKEKSQDIVMKSFGYVETKIKDISIFIPGFTDNKETSLYELLLMLESEEKYCENHKYICEFLNYISSKNNVLERKLN